MIYRVLGELRIGDPTDGRALRLPAGRALNVLAALLIQPNTRLSHTALLRLGWGSTDVGVAQVHKAVSDLRTLLAPIGHRADLATHAGFGYELRAADADHDLLTFERLAGSAESAAAAQRPDEEVELLSRALRLWRGARPLSNVAAPALEDLIRPIRWRRKRVAVRCFTLRAHRGELAAFLDDLQRIAADFPDDHQLQKLLMIALFDSGHRAEAVEVYERYARELARAIGDTDPELRALAYAMGAGDEQAVRKVFPIDAQTVRAAAVPVPRQLPPAPPEFVGRAPLVAELCWLLDADSPYRVLVVPGAGGIGKTALSLHAAHRCRAHFPDGQLWAELRGTSADPADPAEILGQFLRSLHVAKLPDSPAERAALYRSLLADRRMLIFLDDAADGAQIRPLIPAGSGCKVLVTTRRHLPEVPGAHHVGTLEPLAGPDAVALFESVVAASRIDLTAERPAVREVVRLCGGLPLALRIAAALRVHGEPQSTADLAERLRLQGPAAYEFGAESLARTLEAGLGPLAPAHRRLFVDLGLLPMPTFGAWTAAALSEDAGPGRGALTELAAASMVEIVGRPPRRFRFHDLTREYAHRRALAERPGQSGRDELFTRVCAAELGLLRHAHARLYGGDFEVVHSDAPALPLPPDAYAEVDADPGAWFAAERLNIRAAVELAARLGHAGLCWDLAVSAHEFYTIAGLHDDWYATHTTALRACRAAGDLRGEGAVLTCLGQPALVAGGRRAGISGIAELTRAVRLLGDAGDGHGLAIARRTLANAVRRRGRSGEALRLFDQALAGYEAAGDTVGRWQSLRFIGQVHLDRGDPRAAAFLARAEAVAVELGNPRLLTQSRYWSGCALLDAGDLPGAGRAFTAVRELAGPDTGLGHAYALHGLGELARHRHDLDQAGTWLRGAVALAHEHADSLLEGRARLSLAALWQDEGRSGEQLAELGRAARCFDAGDAAYLEVEAQARLALAHADRNTSAAGAAWARVRALYDAGEVPEEDRLWRP